MESGSRSGFSVFEVALVLLVVIPVIIGAVSIINDESITQTTVDPETGEVTVTTIE